jgi:glucose/mannose transport system substrate-binding protein
MMKLRYLGVLGTGLLLFATGCGSDGQDADGGANTEDEERTVEMFSWWISPGEAEALQALVDVHREAHPLDGVINAAADSGSDARARLAERLDDGNPPDLFQQNAHDIPGFLEMRPNAIEPLNELLAENDLQDVIDPAVLEAVTIDGNVYAMPVNVHRENALFYNKQIFEDHELEPPTTIAEFLAVCETLKAEGVTPVATGYQGWILRIMFNSLAMGSMGAESFQDFMTGGARDDAKLHDAIDLFSNVLANYINSNAGDAEFGWTNAAQEVADGNAAMFFHGDWAKGYYVQLGLTPGVDFGVVGAPGASDVFWYGVDTFSLPTGAPSPAAARDFLLTVASPAGQVAFNNLKGSTPVRMDIDKDDLDSEGRATLADFETASVKMRVVGKNVWDDAMLTFAQDGDEDALFQVYVANPPVE